jgi:hypothetical protein
MGEAEAQHIDPQELAAFIDGGLDGSELNTVVVHLADCDVCRAEVAAVRDTLAADVRRVRPAWIAAAAAVVLAGVFFLGSLVQTGATDTGPVLRNGDEATSSIVTVAPGDSVDSADLRFVWRSVGDDATYTVRLMRTDGEVVWSEAQVRDTSRAIPADVSLATGNTYLWTVEGLRPDGRSFASRTQRFVVR